MRVATAALLATIGTLAAATVAHGQDVRRQIELTPPQHSGDVPAVLPLEFVGPPTTGEITTLDLMTRLYKFADDSIDRRAAQHRHERAWPADGRDGRGEGRRPAPRRPRLPAAHLPFLS